MHISNRSRRDVVVVGARVAGASTAMLHACLGHDVVVVDQASFPSDTASTHSIALCWCSHGRVAAEPRGTGSACRGKTVWRQTMITHFRRATPRGSRCARR